MPSKPIQSTDLISAVYELALDPDLFETFSYAWAELVETDFNFANDEEAQEMHAHFQRALEILERLGRNTDNSVSAAQLVLQRAGPALAISPKGKILASSPTAQEVFKTGLPTQSIFDLVDSKSLPALTNAIETVSAGESNVPVLILFENNTPCLFFMTQSVDDQILIDITAPHWQPHVSEFLIGTHQLSSSELELSKLLYRGYNLPKIAAARNRSIETIRKQLATIFVKTGCHSQAQLVKLITTANYFRNEVRPNAWFSNGIEIKHLTLADDRTLSYYDLGKSGDPVLIVLHPFLRTPELPGAMSEKLLASGYRLIGICRAGYGDSSTLEKSASVLEHASADLDSLLAALKISTCSLIGVMGGAVHGLYAAGKQSAAIERVVCISASVPVSTEQQLIDLPPSTRALAYAVKKMPKLLPLLVRSAMALVDLGDASKLVNSLYRKSPEDLQVAQQADTSLWVLRGCQFSTHQGHLPYSNEMTEMGSLTFALAKQVKCPVTFIHADRDQFNKLQVIHEFCAQNDLLKVVQVSDACHLMLYQKPDLLAGEILQALDAKLLEHLALTKMPTTAP